MAEYYVYIMTNRSHMLYTGVTNNIERRVQEHKLRLGRGFAARYNITQLAYYEAAGDVQATIAREKQIKGLLRRKKIALIESVNPEWIDLSLDWVNCHSEGAQRPKNLLETLRCAQGDKRLAQGDSSNMQK